MLNFMARMGICAAVLFIAMGAQTAVMESFWTGIATMAISTAALFGCWKLEAHYENDANR